MHRPILVGLKLGLVGLAFRPRVRTKARARARARASLALG